MHNAAMSRPNRRMTASELKRRLRELPSVGVIGDLLAVEPMGNSEAQGVR
jgi:hypothetical protein